MSAPTTAPRTRRWPWIAAAIALIAVAGLAFGMRAALRAIEQEVAEALGPGATIASIRTSTTAVEIDGVVIPGGAGWPVPESLRAERVRVVPAWSSLLAGRIEIARIEVEAPYLSMLRSRDGGLRVLPTLLEQPSEPAQPAGSAEPTASAPVQSLVVGEIRVRGGTLELFDATVPKEPWKIRVTDLDARLRDVVAPALALRMPFELRGALEGPQRNGQIALAGWIVVATRDLELHAELGSIDLLALEPYLIEASKARLDRGTLDLTLTANVANRKLHAPGHLTLSNLGFASGGSSSAQVLGVPRDLLLAALRAKGGRIALDFSLDGRVDDPEFSLNEALSTRVAVALAQELGVSVGGLARGTLGLGIEGVEGAGKAAGGVGSVLKKLLPRR